MMRRYIKCTYL